MPVTKQSVGVIDIGSNSIKLLVASRDEGGNLVPILQMTDETRIGAGISKKEPRLSDAVMEAACNSVSRLKAEAESSGAESMVIVATSAVRDAVNRNLFADRLKQATGIELRILKGREEAGLIGLGIGCDPGLGSLTNFYVFDLGGGSLEAIKIRGGNIEQAVSLPLGCVRLTEKFIANGEGALGITERVRLETHTREVMATSLFAFDLPEAAEAVVTGGSAAVARLIRETANPASSSPTLSVKYLGDLLSTLGALPLSERREFPGLPPERADVYPTALATLLAILRLGNFDRCMQSFYNLRYGLAARLLDI
ncbi:MAG: phosphatase [Verrucomicrobia bacterium]|nr:MAG: phosphatase [Verrucomicrobiota bacterium]